MSHKYLQGISNEKLPCSLHQFVESTLCNRLSVLVASEQVCNFLPLRANIVNHGIMTLPVRSHFLACTSDQKFRVDGTALFHENIANHGFLEFSE